MSTRRSFLASAVGAVAALVVGRKFDDRAAVIEAALERLPEIQADAFATIIFPPTKLEPGSAYEVTFPLDEAQLTRTLTGAGNVRTVYSGVAISDVRPWSA